MKSLYISHRQGQTQVQSQVYLGSLVVDDVLIVGKGDVGYLCPAASSASVPSELRSSRMAETFTFPGKDLPPGPVDWVDAEHCPRQAVETKGLFSRVAAELVQLSFEPLCCEGGS